MKRNSIKGHLRPYSIYGRRVTTVNHAFASAMAINDDFDDELVSQAIRDLGQDPDAELICAYCGARMAETWDHVNGLVVGKRYSGFGHSIGNLLPCCKQCNSSKGNRHWQEFLASIVSDERTLTERSQKLMRYFETYQKPRFDQDQIELLCPDETQEYELIRQAILDLMRRADEVGQQIRDKTREHLSRQG